MINNDDGHPANVPQVVCIQEFFLEDDVKKNMNRKNNNQKKSVRFSSSNNVAVIPSLTSYDDDGDLLKRSIWYTAEEYAMMKQSNDLIMNEMSRASNDTNDANDDINGINSIKENDDTRDDSNESNRKDENGVPADIKFSFMKSKFDNDIFRPGNTLGLYTHKELKERQQRRRKSISSVLDEQEFQFDFELDQGGSGGSTEIDSDIIKDLYMEATQISSYEALQGAIVFTIQSDDASNDDDDVAAISSSKLVFDCVLFKSIKQGLASGEKNKTKVVSMEKCKHTIRKIPFHGRTTGKYHRRRVILATKAKAKAKATAVVSESSFNKCRRVQNHPRLVVLVQ